MIKVSFVILHFGDIGVTCQCIESILNMEEQEKISIVLVDNDEKLQETYKKWDNYSAKNNIFILKMQKKLGFSEANNKGYQYAIDKIHPEFIVLCNNDIIFTQKDFVSILENCYDKEGFDLLGPEIRKTLTGEHQNPMDSRIRTYWEAWQTVFYNRLALLLYPLIYSFLLKHQNKRNGIQEEKSAINNDYYSCKHENIVLCGACLIFSKKFIREEKKAFDPETQFYYEEYVLTLRCQQKQYKILYDPSLKVLHGTGAATETAYQEQKIRLKKQMKNIIQSCKIYKKYLRNVIKK